MPTEYNAFQRSAQPRRKLASKTAKSSTTVLYECPQGKSCTIETIVMCNVHSGNASIRIHHVGTTESEAISNALYYDLSLSAKATTIDESVKYLTAGDRILMQGLSTDHICITIYGQES